MKSSFSVTSFNEFAQQKLKNSLNFPCFRTLLDTAANFPTSCEEITMAVCPQNVKVKNYVEDEPGTLSLWIYLWICKHFVLINRARAR